MYLSAVLRSGDEKACVKVRNLSPSGAMLDLPFDLPLGSAVSLARGALLAEGKIAWQAGNRCGVQFSSEVSVKEWLTAPEKMQQQRVNEFVELVKVGNLDAAATESLARILPETRQSCDERCGDLETVERLILELEDELASSPETLARHGAKLQNLDIAMQMIRAIRQELREDTAADASTTARLADSRRTCGQAPSAA